MTNTANNGTVTVGQKLFCNGFPGTVTEVCDGKLTGMAVVTLARGTVCVSVTELVRFKDFDARKAVR